MIARNILFNLLGMLAPVVLAFACIPALIKAMGVSSFGLLTLVWVVLGYFSLFDIGIGRALTKVVSERMANQQRDQLSVLIRTAVATSMIFGALGGLLLVVFKDSIVRALARDIPAQWPDVSLAITLVALAIPFVTATAALRGTLEATQRFGVVNVIRLLMGVFSYVGPLLVVQFNTQLWAVVAFLLVGRLAFFIVHLALVTRAFPRVDGEPLLQASQVKPLLALGGWMAVSNIVSPLLSYLDRVVVAAVVGSALLAYYTTPYEAIMRLTLLPDAVMGVLFPALVAALALDTQRASSLFGTTFRLLVAALVPLVLVVVVFAEDLLRLWVGDTFALHGTPVLQLLAVGVLLNSLARLPFTVIHSAGRPDLTAKAHLLELLPFLAVLWLLTHHYGIVGAALAWLLRVAVDLLVLDVIRRRLLSASLGLQGLRLVGLAGVFGLTAGLMVAGWGLLAMSAGCLAVSTLLWFVVLNSADWQMLSSLIRKKTRLA